MVLTNPNRKCLKNWSADEEKCNKQHQSVQQKICSKHHLLRAENGNFFTVVTMHSSGSFSVSDTRRSVWQKVLNAGWKARSKVRESSATVSAFLSCRALSALLETDVTLMRSNWNVAFSSGWSRKWDESQHHEYAQVAPCLTEGPNLSGYLCSKEQINKLSV